MSRRYKIKPDDDEIECFRLSVGEENYDGAFDDDDPIYQGKKQSSANA